MLQKVALGEYARKKLSALSQCQVFDNGLTSLFLWHFRYSSQYKTYLTDMHIAYDHPFTNSTI